METATHPRSAVPKALEFKAFPVLNVRRCVAAWPSPSSACAGWSGRIPGKDVYEPYLLQNGFLNRTPRGRTASALAYEHLGFEKPVQD